MRGGKTLILVAAAALAAGCMMPTDTRTASNAATGGSGTAALRIHVTDEPGGPSLPGAHVLVRSITTGTWGARDEAQTELTTDPQGNALAYVDPDAEIHVEASAPGYTHETKMRVETRDLELPLYHERMKVVIHGRLEPAAVSGHKEGLTEFEWDPHLLAFGGSDAARKGYAARIVLLNFTLQWENTPTSFGDLGIGVGARPGRADVVQEPDRENLAPGHYQETLTLGPREMGAAGWQRASQLYAGSGTGSAYVAPTGLDYTLTADAIFDGEARHESPGFNALWGALVALGGVAVLLPRRGA